MYESLTRRGGLKSLGLKGGVYLYESLTRRCGLTALGVYLYESLTRRRGLTYLAACVRRPRELCEDGGGGSSGSETDGYGILDGTGRLHNGTNDRIKLGERQCAKLEVKHSSTSFLDESDHRQFFKRHHYKTAEYLHKDMRMTQ